MKSTEIIGDVKKSIVCDSGEIIFTVREVFSGEVIETDRSPPSYTMYYFEPLAKVALVSNL